MEHYSFKNKTLPYYIKIPIHLTISLFMSVITLRVILLTLDFFNVGSIWIQYNVELGAIGMFLMICTLFFIFDGILSRLTDTGGFVIILFNAMRDEYDIKRYINLEYNTTADDLDYIRENFAKDFDPKTLMTDKNPLDGIVIPGVIDITAEKLADISAALQNVELPGGEDATIEDFEDFGEALKDVKEKNTSKVDITGFGNFGDPLEGLDLSGEGAGISTEPIEALQVENDTTEPIKEELPIESVEDEVPEPIEEPIEEIVEEPVKEPEEDLNDISVRLAKISKANAIEIRKLSKPQSKVTHKEALKNGNGKPEKELDTLRDKVLAAYQIKLDAEFEPSYYEDLSELKRKQMEL